MSKDKRRARRKADRLRVYMNKEEMQQLRFVASALGTTPAAFLRSTIPAHYDAVNNIISKQLEEKTGGNRADDKAESTDFAAAGGEDLQG